VAGALSAPLTRATGAIELARSYDEQRRTQFNSRLALVVGITSVTRLNIKFVGVCAVGLTCDLGLAVRLPLAVNLRLVA
jgi:hypothetical protein